MLLILYANDFGCYGIEINGLHIIKFCNTGSNEDADALHEF